MPVTANSPPFSGRIDFIIQHESHGPIPVELKSINNAGFNKLIDSPKPEHLVQLQLYLALWVVRFNYSPEDYPPEYGTVLYENKDNQDLKAFLVRYDSEFVLTIFNRCNAIMAMETCPPKCGGDRWCGCRSIQHGS